MPTVTLDSYNSETGCIYFTIYGTPTPTAVTIQKSTDGGANWINDTGPITSPRCGYFSEVPTIFRVRLENGGELSNVFSTESEIVRTIISQPSQISFVNSPVFLRIQNSAQDTNITSAKVRLWVWSGNQNKELGEPNVTLVKSKISIQDDYISFRIDSILKSYLEKPTLGTTSSQPGFGYNVNDLPAVSGQGVFWQIKTEIKSGETTEIIDYETNFATLGWLWNWEKNGQLNNSITRYGSLGFAKPIKKWFNPNIPKYFNQDFVFNQPIETATSSNLISIEVEEKTRTRCTRDSALIVYLDKRGLWDCFTTHGKIVVGEKIESVKNKRIFRDSTKVNSSISHSSSRNSLNITQSWTINTGSIDESDVQRVEELIYSPKVYLIKFDENIITQISEGITIDSTLITIDNTEITIDNTPILPTIVPYFSSYQQIPVTVEDSDFVRKTLINDKTNIDYNIKLEETTNKINSI